MTFSSIGWHPIALAAGVALTVAGVLAFPVYRMLLAIQSRQTVSEYVEEHRAKQGTPTMGGLIIGAGFLAACLLAGPAQSSADPGAGLLPWAAIPLLYLGFALIGFLDDYVIPRKMVGKRGLGWTQKLGMQVLVAGAAAWMLSGSFGFAWGLVVFTILFFSNAYNFADGMDALAGLLLLVMAAGYAVIAFFAGLSGVLPYLAALAAAAVPFLALNWPPAKVFMGDVGALPIGAVLGAIVASIALPVAAPVFIDPYVGGPTMLRENVPSLTVWLGLLIVSGMMLAELIPVPMQVFWVKAFGKRLFLMTPVHHGFQKRGWPERKVVATFVAVQVVMSLVGAGIVAAKGPVPRGEAPPAAESPR